jgi:hypothetical protein
VIGNLLNHFGSSMVSAQVAKHASGAYVKGEWVPGDTTVEPIAIIDPQPVSGKDLQMLPQGENVAVNLVTWAQDSIATREALKDADTVEVRGETYKVTQVQDRSKSGGFYKIFMRKL